MKITREFCPGDRYVYDSFGIAAMGRARPKATRLKKQLILQPLSNSTATIVVWLLKFENRLISERSLSICPCVATTTRIVGSPKRATRSAAWKKAARERSRISSIATFTSLFSDVLNSNKKSTRERDIPSPMLTSDRRLLSTTLGMSDSHISSHELRLPSDSCMLSVDNGRHEAI